MFSSLVILLDGQGLDLRHSDFIHAYHYCSTIFIPENQDIQFGILEIRIASQSS